MGDTIRRNLSMQMTQYQANVAAREAEMKNEEAELANSLMQYGHHAESSYRDREKYHDRIMKDYFIERPRYPPHDFRRRYQMRRELFESTLNTVVHQDHYFARKIDVVGRQSLSPHQKLTSVFQMLANGC
ncbi:uncharacterized protein LOC103960057 [Pyrus x bretschneideri]|uniref:uncharacterized protein LOC103960057 n=1 Tax=Pyrus x bretschneideri TaxID=225117 RepID=UPI0005115FB3|nr:uncharacterized protein LOC103960057 [Pyrus x bretschneideri]